MPFELKNVGATYQRLVNKMFNKQIGRNVESYLDDMLVKSKQELAHLNELWETFTTFKQYQMKLNPSKCVFGVASDKFLGFMVSQRGDRRNPGEGPSHNQYGFTLDCQRSSKAHRQDCSS